MWIVAVRFEAQGGYALEFDSYEEAKEHYDRLDGDTVTQDVYLAEVKEKK